MKTLLLTSALACAVVPAAVPAFAQDGATGTSNPPAAMIDANPDDTSAAAAVRPKPSAAMKYAPAATAPATSYGPYVPYSQGRTAAQILPPRDPDAEIVTSVPQRNGTVVDSQDEDANIVTSVPSNPNEMPSGTLIETRIRETLSTATTLVDSPFTADVIAPMERDGRVIIPAGSTIHGRVTVVRGGRRISGAAALHLLPETVTLPDGTEYTLHGQVVDTSQHNVTRVNDEGTILRRDHVKGTLAAMSLTTGGAAAAGAVFGGVPGALIGGGIGAGVSTIWWLKQDRQEVVPKDTAIVFSLNSPMLISSTRLGTR